MSVFIPLGIGFISNVVVFVAIMLIVKGRRQPAAITGIVAANITLVLAILTFVFSFFIGGWFGMGLGVISFGALLVPVCLYLYTFVIYVAGKR